MNIQFATQSYRQDALPVSAQRCVNVYAEKQPPDAKTPVALFPAPGVTEFATVGLGPVRGMLGMGGLLYVVSGKVLYSVTSAGIATQEGSVIGGDYDDSLSMSENGTQLCIVNGVSGFIFTTTAGFQLISDTDFKAAHTVDFINQRFVFDEIDSGRFFISGSLDGTAYESTEFATAESRPDNTLAVGVSHQIIHVFGERSIELYQDVGAANFPFERIPGAVIERGLAEPHAWCKEDNTIFFLGDDRVFYRLNGTTPLRVSTHALEREWRSYGSVLHCSAFSYPWQGHKFVVLTFPGEINKTWVFDIATGLWHERESWDQFNNNLGRWRVNCAIDFYDKILVGDAYSGKIGYLDASTYTEFGNTIHATMISPPLHADRKRMFMSRFELDVESGKGLTSGQGSDPQVMMDYSDDGGRTFINRQLWKSAGKIGEYRKRLRWTRLGQSRDRMLRIQISDPVPRTIMAAHADIRVGM